jgi:hypothetical protein
MTRNAALASVPLVAIAFHRVLNEVNVAFESVQFVVVHGLHLSQSENQSPLHERRCARGPLEGAPRPPALFGRLLLRVLGVHVPQLDRGLGQRHALGIRLRVREVRGIQRYNSKPGHQPRRASPLHRATICGGNSAAGAGHCDHARRPFPGRRTHAAERRSDPRAPSDGRRWGSDCMFAPHRVDPTLPPASAKPQRAGLPASRSSQVQGLLGGRGGQH